MPREALATHHPLSSSHNRWRNESVQSGYATAPDSENTSGDTQTKTAALLELTFESGQIQIDRQLNTK